MATFEVENDNANEYIVDNRSREDVINQLDLLAKSYTPDWNLDTKNPDIGSTMALLFSHLMYGSIQKMNTLNNKSHCELADMLELTPQRPTPASSVVRFSLADTVDDGVVISKGTKIFAQGDDGEPIHFETNRTIYASIVTPDKLFLSNSVTGKLLEVDLPESGYAQVPIGNNNTGEFLPIIITLTHPYVFCFESGSVLRVHFEEKSGQRGINKLLSDNQSFEWNFLSERGFVQFDRIWYDEISDCVCLQAGESSALLPEDETFAVKITSIVPVCRKIAIKGIYLDTDSKNVIPDNVWCGDIQVKADEFMPFSDTLSAFNECYIACDSVLMQRGAKILMSFKLSLDKKLISPHEENEQELKVVMRKREKRTITPTDVYAQEVSFEYFNGIGWNSLPISNASGGIFAGEVSGAVKLEFICPKDIEPIEINAFFKNWIRIRIIKAEGCYAPNAVHHFPIIKNLSFSHSFDAWACQPQKVYKLCEKSLSQLGDQLRFEKECTLFEPMSIDGNSLLLGFKKPLRGGPINLYFKIENSSMLSDFRLAVFYSTTEETGGFRPLQIVDFTDGFAHSGAVVFAVPPDTRERLLFGKKRFWLRFSIVSLDKKDCNPNIIINELYLNGVEVTNKFTHSPENFYLSPLDMTTKLQLSATDILKADVFVNESIALSVDEMKKMLAKNPSKIKCTYDSLGSIQSFFVKWKEVTSFGGSTPSDRHYILDRVNSQVIFSDGTQAMSPPKQPDVAVTVTAVSTAGEKGNVAAHSINQPYELLYYVDTIDNSLPACNGSDIETREQLLKRASCLLSGGNRIVTRDDLCKAVMCMSNLIAKVKLIKDKDDFTLLVLLRDFEQGFKVFEGIKDRITKEILPQWEVAAITKSKTFEIKQPDYLAVSVSGWVCLDVNGDDMELLSAVNSALQVFLNPVSGGFSGNGWEIGNIPNRAQILAIIRSVCPNGRVEKLCVTGTIDGANGVKEYDLQTNNVLPRAICVSGEHHIVAKILMRGE